MDYKVTEEGTDRRYTRRTCLSAAGSILLAGCLLNDDNDEPPPGLSKLTVQNERNQQVETSITVYKENEQVYDESHALGDADDAWDSDIIEGPWLGEKVFYEVVVDAPNLGTDTFTTDDFLEFAGDADEIACFGLTASIGNNVVDFIISAEEDCSTDRRTI